MSRRKHVRKSILSQFNRRTRRRRSSPAAAMEHLEQRALLSAVSGAIASDPMQADAVPVCEITSPSFSVEDGTATLSGSHLADRVNVATRFGQVFFSISNSNGTSIYSVSDTAIDSIVIDVHCGNDSVTIHGSVSEDVSMSGGHGNDTLTHNGSGTLDVSGGSGNDLIQGGAAFGYLRGNGGNDTIFGGASGDVIVGGAGDDAVLSGGGLDVVLGGVGNDVLVGGYTADIIAGGDGDDTIFGVTGADLIFGDSFNDIPDSVLPVRADIEDVLLRFGSVGE